MTAPMVFVLTASGLDTARTVAAQNSGTTLQLPERLRDSRFENALYYNDLGTALETAFQQNRPIVGIMAAGILIRLLAPKLNSKHDDPPVLAVSEDGKNIVPLLGGHHGANALAQSLAAGLGGHAAVTTAGDSRLHRLLETPPPGFLAGAPERYKIFARHLLEAGTLQWREDRPGLLEALLPASHQRQHDVSAPLTVSVGIHSSPNEETIYPLYAQCLAVGLGAERGVSLEEIETLLDTVLQRHGLAPEAVAGFFSLDLKADETAFRQLAEDRHRPLRFFTRERLAEETPRLKNPSQIVADAVGTPGVAEAAALAAAGPDAELIVEKTKSARATLAIAAAPRPLAADTIGRGFGKLRIVGLGPGDSAWRSQAVREALNEADAVVGFKGYLDLLHGDGRQAEHHGYNLGEETDRAGFALDLAATGKDVALISSGDPGIYAMAAVVFQLLAEAPREAWRLVKVQVLPSVSAFQLAGARMGAPFGHDFTLISLSDLLTPWPVITRRLHAAGEGDFVLALYNPASQRRRAQLRTALDILRQYRPDETPVMLARALGRADERLTPTTLGKVPVDDVDMMTLVIIGATQTCRFNAAGQEWLYTPRGYKTPKD